MFDKEPDVDLTKWVGKVQTVSEVISSVQVRQMAATFNDAARLVAPGGADLPLGWHWLYFNPIEIQSRLSTDGHPLRGDFLPPVKLERRMWAGSRLRWLGPMEIGMQIERQSTILKVDRKIGRIGEMIFVTVAHQYSHGEDILLEEEHDIVYRDQPAAGEIAALQATAEQIRTGHHAFERRGEHMHALHADSVMLYRYSAATFNAHRIHYDVDYCRNVEGYPGLVVHGPLIATLLLDMAKYFAPGQAVAAFDFRALRPTFDLSSFHLHATQEDDQVWQVWSTNNLGQIGLDGLLTLS
jgi:3-methylfumaryl-CoA hydratase